MPKCREFNSEYFKKKISSLEYGLRQKLHANGLVGFLFDDPNTIRAFLEAAYVVGYEEGKHDRTGARRVESIDQNGVVKEYRSVKYAAEQLEVVEGSIQSAIRTGGSCRKMKFRFKE